MGLVRLPCRCGLLFPDAVHAWDHRSSCTKRSLSLVEYTAFAAADRRQSLGVVERKKGEQEKTVREKYETNTDLNIRTYRFNELPDPDTALEDLDKVVPPLVHLNLTPTHAF